MKLLLIGPLPPPLGGTTVLFKQLVDELSAVLDLEVIVINTTRKENNGISNAFHALRVILKMASMVRGVDVVSFHTSTRGASMFGPLVWLICRLYGKKWVFRVFGGNFKACYCKLSWLSSYLLRHTALLADVSLFETKESVEYFKSITSRPVLWYANSRRYSEVESYKNRTNKGVRFVFVGHVKPSKGVYQIIEAGESLEGDVVIDVYGPLLDGISEATFMNKKVRYCGVLQPKDVEPTMRGYDALLLPTYYEGEGYPGVILEAYCSGLPVITTRWRAIPEIVDGRSGILIEPGSVEQLTKAMQALVDVPEKLDVLRQGAFEMAREFSSEIWTERFLEINRSLLNDEKIPRADCRVN